MTTTFRQRRSILGLIPQEARPFIIGFLGGTKLHRLFMAAGASVLGAALPEILVGGGQGNVVVVSSAPGDPARVVETRVTNAAVLNGQVSEGIAFIAAWLGFMWPNEFFVLKIFTSANALRYDLVSDGADAWNWNSFDRVLKYRRDEWGPVGLVLDLMRDGDAEAFTGFSREFAPPYLGETNSGQPFTPGSVNPEAFQNAGRPVDHLLWDDERGRGAFGISTKWAIIPEVMPRPQDEGFRAFAADPRVLDRFGIEPVGLFGLHQGAAYPAAGDPQGHGQGLAALSLVPAIAKARGLPVRQPEACRATWAQGGTSARLFLGLPNNGQLTTDRIEAALPPPEAPLAFQQPVTGVFIQREGMTLEQAQPIYRLGSTAGTVFDESLEGTVTLADQGVIGDLGREGVLLVTPHPNFPFQAGDALVLMLDMEEQSPPPLDAGHLRDSPSKPIIDFPIETQALLSDLRQPPALRLNGIPFRMHRPRMVMPLDETPDRIWIGTVEGSSMRFTSAPPAPPAPLIEVNGSKLTVKG